MSKIVKRLEFRAAKLPYKVQVGSPETFEGSIQKYFKIDLQKNAINDHARQGSPLPSTDRFIKLPDPLYDCRLLLPPMHGMSLGTLGRS